jgi:hypothetical protein
MASLYDLLNKIHQKPGIYIGVPSVSGLHLFLCGYAFSCQEQGLAITAEEQTFAQFQPWIQQRFNIAASVSWAKIILLHSADKRARFELFFELWAEFVDQKQQITTNKYERVVA